MNDLSPRDMIKMVLFLAGGFTFAFLLGEAVHETGHYLAHLAYGNRDVRVHLDPWGGSRILGATSLPLNVMGITALCGTLFNLLLVGSFSFLLFRYTSAFVFPFLLWGPVSMIQEGVTFSLGQLTPGVDAAWIIAMGFPGPYLLTVGGLLVLAGIVALSILLLRLRGFHERPFRTQLMIVFFSFGSLMAFRTLHSLIFSPQTALENSIPLVFSIALAFLTVVLLKPVSRYDCGKSKSVIASPDRPAAAAVLSMGAGLFLFQIWITT